MSSRSLNAAECADRLLLGWLEKFVDITTAPRFGDLDMDRQTETDHYTPKILQWNSIVKMY